MLVQVLERARYLGFLGPGPIPPHVDHARLVQPLIDARFDAEVEIWCLDLGSGGGLPGLVLATDNPKTKWCLLDANLRRTEFLAWAVEQLSLEDRVRVLRGRAEVIASEDQWRDKFDLVTARSFAPPAVTAESAAPFMAPGGYLIVSEPPEHDLQRWPVAGLAELGLLLEEQGEWAVIRRFGDLPDRFPRREGVAAKRPLW